jgi:hypothetical protein
MGEAVYCRQHLLLSTVPAALMPDTIPTPQLVILLPPTEPFVLPAHPVLLLPELPFRLKAVVKDGNVLVPVEEQRLLVWLLEVQLQRRLITYLKLL